MMPCPSAERDSGHELYPKLPGLFSDSLQPLGDLHSRTFCITTTTLAFGETWVRYDLPPYLEPNLLLFHYIYGDEIADIRENGFSSSYEPIKFKDRSEETCPGVYLTTYPYIQGPRGSNFEAAFALEIPEDIVKPFEMESSPRRWRRGYRWFWVPADVANQYFAFRINLRDQEPEILYAWLRRCARCNHMVCLHPSPQGWKGACTTEGCSCLEFEQGD